MLVGKVNVLSSSRATKNPGLKNSSGISLSDSTGLNTAPSLAFKGNPVGVALSGIALTIATFFGCNKTEVPTPPVVKPPADTIIVVKPTTTGLRDVDSLYMNMMKAGGFVDSTETGMLDEIKFNDGRSGQNVFWKVDTSKSKGKTLVIDEVISSSGGVPQAYNRSSFHRDGSDLGDSIYSSRNFKPNDTQYDFEQIRKMILGNRSVVETNLGKDTWKYYGDGKKNVIVEFIRDAGKKLIQIQNVKIRK